MPPEPSEESDQIDLLLAETELRLADLSARSQSLASRAGFLVASAAITASLIDASSPTPTLQATSLFEFLAAALGVYALFPIRSTYEELPKLRRQIFREDIPTGRLRLVDARIALYEASMPRLKRHGWAVRAGYISLGTSIGIAALERLSAR